MHVRRIRRRKAGPLEDVMSALSDVRSAITSLTESAEETGRAGILQLRATGRRARKLADRASDRAEDCFEDTWNAIRSHPKIATSVVAALGIGILAGIFLSRRR